MMKMLMTLGLTAVEATNILGAQRRLDDGYRFDCSHAAHHQCKENHKSQTYGVVKCDSGEGKDKVEGICQVPNLLGSNGKVCCKVPKPVPQPEIDCSANANDMCEGRAGAACSLFGAGFQDGYCVASPLLGGSGYCCKSDVTTTTSTAPQPKPVPGLVCQSDFGGMFSTAIENLCGDFRKHPTWAPPKCQISGIPGFPGFGQCGFNPNAAAHNGDLCCKF